MRQRRAEGPAGGVPPLSRALPSSRSRVVSWSAACEEGPAVGAERHGMTRVSGCRRGGPMGRPVAASQSRAVLSQLPVRMSLAVGAERHGMDHRLMFEEQADGWPVSASQSRTVPSLLPVRKVLPSGLNATARPGLDAAWAADGLAGGGVPEPRRLVRAPGEDGLAVGAECHGPYRSPDACKGWPMGRPVAASQSRAVLSWLPVRMVLPSGLNATDMTRHLDASGAGRWAGRWRHPRAAPCPCAPGEDRLAVGAERHADLASMAEGSDRSAGRWRRPRAAPCCPQLPVRMVLPSGLNATAADRASMLEGRPIGSAGGGVPEPRRPVRTPGEDGLAVGAERHGSRPRAGAGGRADGPAGGRVPEPRRAVITAGDDVLPSGLKAASCDGTGWEKTALSRG